VSYLPINGGEGLSTYATKIDTKIMLCSMQWYISYNKMPRKRERVCVGEMATTTSKSYYEY
jgi:hypothetical protein